MQARHAIAFLETRTLLITPGDRDDLVRAALAANREGEEPRVAGLVLTGGFVPADDLLAELRAAQVFTYLVATDTYRTAQAVDEILVKTHPSDTEKIATIIDLVGRSLDVDGCSLGSDPPPSCTASAAVSRYGTPAITHDRRGSLRTVGGAPQPPADTKKGGRTRALVGLPGTGDGASAVRPGVAVTSRS